MRAITALAFGLLVFLSISERNVLRAPVLKELQERGSLFAKGDRDAAESLRSAQLEMLCAGDLGGGPRCWEAYAAFGGRL